MTTPTLSLLERAIQAVVPEVVYASLNPKERKAWKYAWRVHARPSQIAPPGDWLTWLVMAGRGEGKTRRAAEFMREEIDSGRATR